MSERPAHSAWAPTREAPILLAVQLVTLWQAGFRALDYLTGSGAPALDAAADGALAGVLLYAAVIATLAGIAMRRAPAIIAGHLLLAGWYLGVGGVTLMDRVEVDPHAVVGAAVAGVGAWLVLRLPSGPWARTAGAVAMLAGQVLIAAALGGDYRTGTGLLGQGLTHGALAAGTFVLWQRRDLRAEVEAEGRRRE